MKPYIIILMLLTLIQTSSCKKMLDKKPSSNLSTPESLQDLQAILDHNMALNYDITPSMPESSADNFFLLSSSRIFSNLGPPGYIYIWTFYPSHSEGNWLESYGGVYSANACLEYLPRITRTSENKPAWDNIKGSALYYRAYHFLQLCWGFAKAYDAATATTDYGIVLTENTDINAISVRSSVQQCYDKIIADAKEALSFLPDLPLNATRPSKAAAFGLLARIYLSMQVYDSAGKYANNCLQLNGQLIDYNGDTDINQTMIAGSGTPFIPFNKETIFYTTMMVNGAVCDPNQGALVDTLLYNSYAASDVRKVLFFTADAGYQRFRGSYSNILGLSLFTGIATDEMYLTRAECYAHTGNREAALTDLNTLLIKRWKTGAFSEVTASTAEEALDIILEERRKELIFRGLRWMDIKRLNKENRNIVLRRLVNGQEYQLLPNSDKYALPLPQDIIDMTGIPQNPGWAE